MLQGVARFRPQPGRVILPDICCGVSCVGGRQLLTGPMTQAGLSSHVGQDVLLLQMAPATARRLLGVPVAELTDRVVPLDEVNPVLAREISERLETSRLLELVGPLPLEGKSRRFAAAAAALARGGTVSEAASLVALCERQLERLVYEHAGMSPKLLARIVRFRRAVVAACAGLPLAASSAAHGYADQAHFSREARSLTGRALRPLLPNVGNLQEVVSGEL